MPNFTLMGLIQSYPDDADVNQILADLTAKNIVEKDSTLYTYRTLVIRYGLTFAGTIMAKLDAASASNPLIKATYLAVCSTGIDFSVDAAQGMIDQLTGPLFTQDEADKLKALGVLTFSRLDKANLVGITTDDITQAMADRIYIRDVYNWFNNLFNQIAPQIESGTISKDQIKTIINNA